MKRVKNNNPSQAKRTRIDEFEEKCGEIGIIESVSLVNFMCHENLVFQFGPRINFVIGKNGSGKSALLTAIILALGGRSSVTGRYPNIKGFVLQGKQKAKIEVALKNCGNQAYKPDIYGSQIIVCREITCDGGSSYKIKSSSGKIISQHKEELSKILTVMNIQIENPVSALTQESSRTFLTAKKPEKLYQFFYKGTGLEALEVGYNIIQHNKEEAAEELRRKKELLPDMERDLKSLEKILNTSAKVVDLKNELLWATINEMEKGLKDKCDSLGEAENHISFLKEEHVRNQDLINKKSTELTDLKNNRDDCDKNLEIYRAQLTELNQKKETIASDLRFNEGKLSSLKRDAKNTSNEILSLQRSLTEKNLKDKSSFEEDEAKRRKEIELLNEKQRECTEKVAQISEEIKMEHSKQNELKSECENVRSEINMLIAKRVKSENIMHCMKMTLQSQVNKFGPKTEHVLKEIQMKREQFSKLPIGPIGIYVKVKDPKWCAAVETCLNPNMLSSFCCNDNRDSMVLKDILRKYYPDSMPSVIVSQFLEKVHEGLNKVQSKFPTVLDMLEIENPVVANCLIDLCRIEGKILIEDKKTAVEIMLESPPRNCVSAYLLDCSNIVLNPFRFYSSLKKSQHSLLSSVPTGDFTSITEEIQQINEGIAILREKEQSLLQKKNHFPKLIQDLGQKQVQHNVLLKNISARIRDLETTEDHIDTLTAEEDLEQLKVEYQKNKSEVEKFDAKVQEGSAIIADLNKEMGKYKILLQDVTKHHKEICSLMSACMQEKETLKRAQDKLKDDIKEEERKIDPLQIEIEVETENVQENIKNALEVGPRINTRRSCDAIRRLLSETEKVVKQHSNCSREVLLKKHKEKAAKLREAKGKLILKEENIELIEKMYSKRRQNFQTVCNYTQFCIDVAYMVLIQEHFSGKLVFNTEKRLLNLEACPKKSGIKVSGGGKCVSLSGGEKSFVTIAFLLAMWERIKTPFKILDEYDVFMDSNNRKLSIDLLIGQAKMMPDSQFIFLSPLELPQIQNSPLIKLLPMPAPKRNMNNIEVET